MKDNNQQNEGDSADSDNAEKGADSPPKPVGFFDHSLNHVRKEVFWKWALTTLVLCIFILAVLSIYWGSLFHVEQNLSSLVVYVVDMDAQVAPYNTSGITPLVGPTIVEMARKMVASASPTLGFGPLNAVDFNYDPIAVRQAVYDFKAWAAIIINPNATAMLYSAVQNGNVSYDPLGACQLVYMDSRDDTNWYDFMAPILSSFQTEAQTMIGSEWTRMVLQNATTDTTLLSNVAKVPQALSPAIGFSMFNLRPFYPYQVIPSVTVGLIYLIIISFFSFSFYLPVYTKLIKPQGHPPLKFWQMVGVRYIGIMGAYFFLSLSYSLLSLAFQINFSGGNPVTSETQPTLTVDGYTNPDAFGKATFPAYWCLNFLGMMALGLACENVAMIAGQPWTGLWLIFWVITNVSTSFYDIDLEPHFYYWGYAWPLHYVVEGTRTLLFDLHSRLGLDYSVLIIWAVVNSCIFPICCRFMKYKNVHHVHEYWA